MNEQFFGSKVKVLTTGDTYAVQVFEDSFFDEAAEWKTVAINLSRSAMIEKVQALLAMMASGLDAQ